MLVIRLRRAGSKGRPFFRVVVAENSAARDGRFVEVIGHYNPRTTPETLVVDRPRYDHWLGVGATPSDSVRTLVKRMPEAAAATAPEAGGAGPAEEPDAATESPAPAPAEPGEESARSEQSAS